ncbi:MAG: radical SAM protein [Terriglobia bacterium]
MVDVLLTHSYHLYFDRKQARKMKPYPPLGTLYAASVLRTQGFTVALFDSMLENPEIHFEAALRQHRPRIVVVFEDSFNFLSKMCLQRMRELSFLILDASKQSQALTIVHGSDATDHQEDYLERGFDYVLIGEAEWTLLELVQSLLQGQLERIPSIPGIAYRSPASSRRINTPPRRLMRNLDLLPLPAWDLIDGDRYRFLWEENHGYFSLNLVSSRGCPYLCNWCAKPIYGNSYSVRSPEKVAFEMAYLKELWAPDQLWFADDIFALPPHWVEQFSQAVRQKNAVIPFKIQSRVDLMTLPTARHLADAGCCEVWMGAESGSQQILKAMDKGIEVSQIKAACDNLKTAGIRRCFFLQFGYPGERWEDIRKTIDLVRATQPDDIGVSVSYPLPGTKFHQKVLDQLGSKTNWEDSEDLAMLFQGTYTSEFYHALRDALHFEVKLARWRRERRNDPRPARYSPDFSLETDQVADERLQELWDKVTNQEIVCRNAHPTIMEENPAWICS